MLKKWLALYSRWFMVTVEYRVELALWFLHDLIPTVVLIFVWSQLYRDAVSHGGYTLSDILQYYLLVVVISMLTGIHFEQFRAEEVREGKIDHFFTRPIGYFWEITIGAFASKSFYLLMSVPLIGALWWAVNATYHVGVPQATLTMGLVFVGLMIGAYIVEFILSLLVVILSFWFEGAEGLVHFKWLVVSLFSGWMIPVYLMPDWLRWVVEKLPFQYMYAVPISVIQGKTVLSWGDGLYFLSCIVVLAVISNFLWRRALLRYASAGG